MSNQTKIYWYYSYLLIVMMYWFLYILFIICFILAQDTEQKFEIFLFDFKFEV